MLSILFPERSSEAVFISGLPGIAEKSCRKHRQSAPEYGFSYPLPRKEAKSSLNKKVRNILLYAAAVLIILLLMFAMLNSMMQPETASYTYSDFVYMFEDGVVKEYQLNVSTGDIIVVLDDDNPEASQWKENTVPSMNGDRQIRGNVAYATRFMSDVSESVEKYNIQNRDDRMKYNVVVAKDNSLLWQVIMMFVPLILLGIMFFFIMRQTGGGGKINSFAKANTKTQSGKKTTFVDVAGADEEKEELFEIVEFLKKPEKYNQLGARIPKGVLLVGPPGTGKTLLARAVAGEAGVPFYSISGSDFVEMFVGVGASRVRDLFSTAKKNSPSIVFIDEIDAVGRQRGAGLGGGHDEREQTLNQLLVEMDGFGDNEGVIVMAATNRRDVLDPALLRPGRFDRQVVVGYPDVRGREAILKVHARNKPLGFDVDLNKIARTTAGFTGADLENLLNEAALLAAKNHRKAIIEADIEAATVKVVAGPEKRSHKISDKDKRITAYHEAGHAVVTYHCPTQDKVHEVSIIPRGVAAGYTMHLPAEDRLHMARQQMREELSVLLAGRAAEELMLDDICTGASNDIERATQTARDMVTRYGFSSTLGPVVYGQPEGEVFLGRDFAQQRNYSENVAKEIDSEIRELIDDAYEKARGILQEHQDQLTLIAEYLIEYEKINGETFDKLMKGELTFTPKTEEEREAERRQRQAEEEAKAAEERAKEASQKRGVWSDLKAAVRPSAQPPESAEAPSVPKLEDQPEPSKPEATEENSPKQDGPKDGE